MKQLVPLHQAFLITHQVGQIDPVELAQFPVNKTSSFGRPVFDHIEIFRREKDHRDQAEKLRGLPDRNAVNSDAFCLLLFQMHVDPAFDVVFAERHPDVAFGLTEFDHVLIFCRPMRACRAAKIKSLENIGFPLGVAAPEKIGPSVKLKAEVVIISEMTKF